MIEGLVARVQQYQTRAELEESPVPLGTPEQAVPVELMKTGGMQAFDASKPQSVATPVAPARTAKPAPKPESMMSDDIMGSLVKRPEGAPPVPPEAKPAFDPMSTQKMSSGVDSTQKMSTGVDSTQKMPTGHDQTQKLSSGVDSTQKMPTGHDQTQKMPSGHDSTQRIDKGPEHTQPIPNVPKAPELPREVRDDRTIQTKRLDPKFNPESTQRIDTNPPTTPLAGKDGMSPEATQRLDDSIWRLEEAKRILKGVKEKS